jgi:hypothetical protein
MGFGYQQPGNLFLKGSRQRDRFLFLFLGFISLGVFLSCGIDEYQYLDSVSTGNIQVTLNERVTIQLPSINANYFTHFTIFYRIYISAYNAPGTIQTSYSELSRISPTLASDYSSIEPSTTTAVNNNNNSTSNASSIFKSRNYYELAYQSEGNVREGKDVLNTQNTTLLIDFPTTMYYPYLTIKGDTWDLYRSTGSGNFTPVPDRYFVNTSELNSSDNAISTRNGDVANNSVTGQRYTYASLYIVATGLDQQSYTPIYSIPTFIGIFRLPDPLP